jgi:hypothetical protein
MELSQLQDLGRDLNYSRVAFDIRLWKWLIKTLTPIYGNGWIERQPFMETVEL